MIRYTVCRLLKEANPIVYKHVDVCKCEVNTCRYFPNGNNLKKINVTFIKYEDNTQQTPSPFKERPTFAKAML